MKDRTKKICSIDGCEGKHYSKSYCRPHYRKLRKYGDPEYIVVFAKDKKCKVATCESLVGDKGAKGWCAKHYRAWHWHGDAEYVHVHNYEKPCPVEGCDRYQRTGGYCDMHYKRWLKHKDPHYEYVPETKVPEPCSVEGCSRDSLARELCVMHYSRWRTHGDPSVTLIKLTQNAEESFRLRTQWQGKCLVWTGAKSQGYGSLVDNGQRIRAHRYAWKRVNGPIPDGMLVDHICHNPSCVNIEHLRLATPSQNAANRKGPDMGSSSGARNVYPLGDDWQVVVGGQFFGRYSVIEEAVEVAEAAREDIFGEFAGKG